jgi:ATP-dependent helicase/nuclease subunit A
MGLTSAQQDAVTTRGNVVVVAGAGAGKTSTLVARCLHCLLDEKTPVPLDGLLLVTFTDAAAADMRKKIRAEIERRIRALEKTGKEIPAEGTDETPHPGPLPLEGRGSSGERLGFSSASESDLRDTQKRVWLTEQLALFETAHIGTLHSFCLKLVREHFYELELDPQLTVMPEEEQHLQAQETLDKILEDHYAGKTRESRAVQELIQIQGRGSEGPIRDLVLKLHHYAQTLRDPAGWFAEQLAMFESPNPERWAVWLADGIRAWRDRWLPALRAEADNPNAAKCVAALECLTAGSSLSEYAVILDQALAADGNWPTGKKGALRKPLEDFFEGTKFLRSLTRARTTPAQRPQNAEPRFATKLATRVSVAETEEAEDSVDPDFGKLWEVEDETSPVVSVQSQVIALANEKLPDREEMPAPPVNSGSSRSEPSGAKDPLKEDWDWVRGQMKTLLGLALEFGEAFSRAKRELGVVDFHDLEQHALRLLIDPETRKQSGIAKQWQSKLHFVFVDEYQDINDAQDAILRAVSREGAAANRFLVGDVKQSIYRFRLADPHIFQNYIDSSGEGRIIALSDNFRSREAILGFINSFFSGLMRREIGGVPYGDDARLRFGDPENRHGLSLAHDPTPRVELRLRLKRGGEDVPPSEDETDTVRKRAWTEMMNLEEPEKEARMVALRLKELKAESHLIWDEETKSMRPVEWRDMAILLRSPSRKAEAYAKEFTRLGVPLLVARGGFYESMEVMDLLSLLRLLDNPLQDLPLVAVLHSPLVGMTVDELATIRLMLARGTFWAALQRYHETDHGQKPKTPAVRNKTKTALPSPSGPPPEGWVKANRFLEYYAVWRRLARQDSLSRCLETVLAQTHYSAWLLTQSRGEQRRANVQRLLALAQQFDRFQRQGLFRFLRFIEAQQAAETEPEVGLVSAENAVSLMSIHQSKGLEFPVVVAADLAKPFNLSDLRADIILDEQYGLCPQVKPPHTGRRYPSLPYWLARQRQRREMLGEEMRLLYVAMTRARDTLILTGAVSERDFNKRWAEAAPAVAGPEDAGGPTRDWKGNTTSLLTARSYLDWIAAWTVALPGALLQGQAGTNWWLSWKIYEDAWLLLGDQPLATGPESAATNEPRQDPREWRKLQERLAWKYPHPAAIQYPAKTSVSILRRQLAEAEADGDEMVNYVESKAPASPGGFGATSQSPRSKVTRRTRVGAAGASKLSAAEVGTAHHTFLQWVSLERVGSVAGLQEEAKRLADDGTLLPTEAERLDLEALAGFWKSNLGRRIAQERALVRRELAFTARFSPDELTRARPAELDLFEDEFVVVQGVADLVVLLPDEIWLVDFKTDELREDELDQRIRSYEPQIRLYSMALSRIYRRPVRESYLHFLASRRTVKVGMKGSEVQE